MKMWIVREHRGDNYVLFPLEKKPVQWEDKYWYQNGSRGIIISRWRYPELLFPKMEYDSPRHKTKGVVETVVGVCKIKYMGAWVDGVLYEGNDTNTGEPMTFVRVKEDFENNFEVL